MECERGGEGEGAHDYSSSIDRPSKIYKERRDKKIENRRILDLSFLK